MVVRERTAMNNVVLILWKDRDYWCEYDVGNFNLGIALIRIAIWVDKGQISKWKINPKLSSRWRSRATVHSSFALYDEDHATS